MYNVLYYCKGFTVNSVSCAFNVVNVKLKIMDHKLHIDYKKKNNNFYIFLYKTLEQLFSTNFRGLEYKKNKIIIFRKFRACFFILFF